MGFSNILNAAVEYLSYRYGQDYSWLKESDDFVAGIWLWYSLSNSLDVSFYMSKFPKPCYYCKGCKGEDFNDQKNCKFQEWINKEVKKVNIKRIKKYRPEVFEEFKK